MAFWDAVVPTLGGALGGFAMGGPLGAVAGGAAGFAGYESNRRATAEANQQASAEADKNRGFQASMSNTAHQREVADLKAAGLNPTLSGDGGQGSSSPAGGMAPVAAAAPPNITFPDILQAKTLNQKDRELDMEGQRLAAFLAKNATDIDLNKMDKILKQKGMIRANLEGRAAGAINDGVNYFKKRMETINPSAQERKKVQDYIMNNYNKEYGTDWNMNQIMLNSTPAQMRMN